MARVACQIIHRPERVSVLWSEGGAGFEPYHLEGAALTQFHEVARQARERLAAAATSAEAPSAEGETALELATLGRHLYRLLFQLDGPPSEAAQAVHDWWQALRGRGGVASLELVSDIPGRVPWNLIYDPPPDSNALRQGPGSPDWGQFFWGFQFALGVGRRVSPLRAFPYFDKPALLVALDPAVESQLPGEQREHLERFVGERGGVLVRSLDELLARLRKESPDVLAIISRVERGQILIGDRAGQLRELRQALAAAETGNPQPMVLLLGSAPDSRAPEGLGSLTGSWECFLASASSELSSIVARKCPARLATTSPWPSPG